MLNLSIEVKNATNKQKNYSNFRCVRIAIVTQKQKRKKEFHSRLVCVSLLNQTNSIRQFKKERKKKEVKL